MTDHDRLDWRAEGACLTADPDLFFPLSATGAAAAQAERACRICAGCRVLTPCLEFALKHAEVDGIWGGTTQQERLRTRVATAPRGQAARTSRAARRAA
jgi:WhiB family redox-sensing transcriptional regulator